MRKFSMKKIAAGVAVTALAVGVGGAAFGFWTTGGSGDGNATSSTASNVVISASIGNFTGLDTTNTFNTLLTNNNSGAADVTGKTLHLTSVDCSGGVAAAVVGVPTAWFTLGGNITPPAGTIAGNDSATIVGTTLTLNGAAANEDACQGATITAHLALS